MVLGDITWVTAFLIPDGLLLNSASQDSAVMTPGLAKVPVGGAAPASDAASMAALLGVGRH